MSTGPIVTLRKDRCALRQVGLGHTCGKGCGLIGDGGLGNSDRTTREKTRRYNVCADPESSGSALDVSRTIDADRAASGLEPLRLSEKDLRGHHMCSVAYDRVRTITNAGLDHDDMKLLPEDWLIHTGWLQEYDSGNYDAWVHSSSSDPDELNFTI